MRDSRGTIQLVAALVLFWSLLTPVYAQPTAALENRFPEPRFEHIGLKDGLPENTVRCILQDRFGFLWLGTQNGLVKYDGYSMVVYQQEPDDAKSISANDISSLYEDRAGTLWVGTSFGGLNKFNRSNESFARYVNNPLDSNSIGSNQVGCIYEDNSGRLWVGCVDGGLCLLDRKTGRFTRYYLQDWSYGPDVYEYVSVLEKTGHRIGSIVNVGNNANTTTRFTLKQKADVLLVVMGEGVADYGWLESERGSITAQYDSARSLSAGGRSDNRVQVSVVTLNAGRYRIRYRSDESHSYNRWLGEPPSHPECWGIQVFDISGEVEKTRRIVDALVPMNRSTSIRAVIEDQQTGDLFVGGNKGIWTFDVDGKVFSKHNPSHDDHIFSHGYARAFHRARDGTLWIASNLGLTHFDSRMNISTSYQVTPSMKYVSANNFGALFEDPTGLIWIGNYIEPALESFDPQSGRFRRYVNDPNNLFSLSASMGIFSTYVDRSGVLWVGTFAAGLNKWDRRKRRFNTIEFDPRIEFLNSQNSIYEDHAGRILVGASEGLVQLSGEQKGSPDYPYSHSKNIITDIVEDPTDRGVLWIGSRDSGLVRFDSETGLSTQYRNDPRDTNSLSTNAVQAILVDHEGVLWVATEVGLNRLDRATGRFTKFTHDPTDPGSISQNRIKDIYEDRSGILWITNRVTSTADIGGMNRFDPKTGQFSLVRSFVAGRALAAIFGIHEDQQGNLWVADYLSGLHLFDRTKGRSVRRFTEKDGLSSNSVGRILEDDSGHLWIGTGNGLSRFDLRNHTFKNFWVEDGLPDNSLFGRSLKTHDGRMIFGGPKGMIVFHPDSIKDDPVPPQVVIANVSLFNRPDEKLALNGYVPELKAIGLSYNENDLRFDYVGLQFSEPARNRYKYILENFDRDWVDAGTQRNATYTNLDPGEYTFRVNAANRDGVWNEEGASIRILISPPWWKTIWAYCGYGVVVVSVLYSFRQFEKKRDRLKQQTELQRVEHEKRQQQEFSKQLIDTQEAERKRVASELHDSLGQHLLIVNNELQFYQQGKGQNDPDIQRTTSIVRDAIKEVREIAANLHPHHLEKLGLRAAVEAMIEQFSRSTPVKFDAAIAEVDNALSQQVKINLYRVLQEALANIVRHSGATHAKITVSHAGKTVDTIIEDNGKGFTPGASQGWRQGFGLKSMAERITLCGGTIMYDSTPGKGTRVRIVIPIHK